MNRCIQIWYDCSPGISDDLINFWDESGTIKWLLQPLKKDGRLKSLWAR